MVEKHFILGIVGIIDKMATAQEQPENDKERVIATVTNIGNSQGVYIEQDKLDESGLEIGDQVLVDDTTGDARGLELVKLNDVLDY